jgi:formate-dependent nitrite reductase membrane component NrfD
MPEPAAASRYRGDTYYGRPALKPSPFGWTVAFYIFEGGLAGAAQIIATVADCFGPPEARALVRRGRYIAFLGAAAGAGLLIVELHKPARFFNMLRIFRATSPMSIGSYVLTSFGAFSGLAALGQLVEDRGRSRGWPRWLARISQVPAALAGAGMTTYTAALLASTSTPLLAAEPQLLAIRFASSSVASGAAALSLAGRLGSGERDNPALDTLATAAAGVELAASLASEARYRAAGVAGPLQKAPWGPSQKLGVVVAGTLAPIGLYALSRARGRRSPGLSIAASLALLAGSFAMRAIMLQAGNESAMRPRDYFRFAQPGRTPQRQALEGQPG